MFASGAVVKTVALVGPDGAGKSTVVRSVVRAMPVPARSIYMGVNLEASRTMLPTTRLALALKRRKGGRPDMTAGFVRSGDTSRRRGVLGAVRSGVRLAAWTAEEWYRALLAARATGRGEVVVFDRHFYCDYYAADVRPRPGRPLASRLHGFMLRRFYPKPDLVVVLDAPASVLHGRKQEDAVETLEQRRRDYLSLADALPDVVVVDAARPVDAVTADVVAVIRDRLGMGATADQAPASGPAQAPTAPPGDTPDERNLNLSYGQTR